MGKIYFFKRTIEKVLDEFRQCVHLIHHADLSKTFANETLKGHIKNKLIEQSAEKALKNMNRQCVCFIYIVQL